MIPIPMHREGQGLKYPWKKFTEIGYSEFIETKKTNGIIQQAATNYWNRRGVKAKFTTRKLTEDGKKGIRIWRME